MGRLSSRRAVKGSSLIEVRHQEEPACMTDAVAAGEMAQVPSPFLRPVYCDPADIYGGMEAWPFGMEMEGWFPYGDFDYNLCLDAHGAYYGTECLLLDPTMAEPLPPEEAQDAGDAMVFSALLQALGSVEQMDPWEAPSTESESVCNALLEALTEVPSQPRKKGQLRADLMRGSSQEDPGGEPGQWAAAADPQDDAGVWTPERKRERKARATAAATTPQKEPPAAPAAAPAAASAAAAGATRTEPQPKNGVERTTAMLRNIPNKYTREMLVRRLDVNFRGEFDFLYLPIDFKNKCNVGYAFINFRSVKAYERFGKAFDGVAVSECLPGLNSHKVAEVTPARVHGFEENVSRLRSSRVMLELSVQHPEWMPLLFDRDGKAQPFPAGSSDAVRDTPVLSSKSKWPEKPRQTPARSTVGRQKRR